MRIWLIPAAGVAGFALAVVPALAHDESVGTTSRDWTKKELAVAPGHKVTIRNNFGGNHDLHWSDGAKGVPEPGLSWTSERTFTADDNGKAIRFVCKVHESTMVGTVHVNQAETVPQPGSTTGGGTTTGGSTTTTQTTTTQTTTTGTTTGPADSGAGTTPGSDGSPDTTSGPEETDTDRTAPGVKRLAARIQGRRLVLRLRLGEAARITVRVSRGQRRVTRGTFRGRAGANRFVLRRKLPRGSLTLRLVVADAAGNTTRRRLTVRG